MKTSKFAILIFSSLISACSQQALLQQPNTSRQNNYEGIYETGNDFYGYTLKIEKNNRFVESGWSDSGKSDSTAGRWEPSEVPGIIRLYSDIVPKPNRTESDASFKGFKVIINRGLYGKLDFTVCEIHYADTTIYRLPDSTGVLLLDERIPHLIKVSALESFSCIHIIDSVNCLNSIEWAKTKYGTEQIISCGKSTENVILVRIQKKYGYDNGDAYFLFNNQAFPLRYGLIKVSQ